MKTSGFFLLGLLFIGCSGTSSDSQPAKQTIQSSFEATTPFGDAVKKILGITTVDKYEMMKWSLTLNKDPKKFTPTTFDLIYEYGMPKQGTRGFMDGSKKVVLNGTWVTEKGALTNKLAPIITLTATGAKVSLSFLQPDENVLHLLDDTKALMVGNGAWSYTLNRKEPVSQNSLIPGDNLVPKVSGDTDTVGIFVGRTPCYSGLTIINNIAQSGCQLVKCELVLLQDVNTHTPANFVLKTVYVGKGDNKYTTIGKWEMLQYTTRNATAIVYQLKPDATTSTNPISLLKGDDNILFFMETDGRLLVGNNYSSYTLNRAK